MTKYRIKLCSKDKQSLHHFLNFLKHNTKTQNFQLLFNLLRKKKIVKKVTVLKSPHINKTAQEQFGYKLYSIDIICCSWETKKYLIILKKIKNQLFPDVEIQVSGKFSGAKKSVKELLLNPINITFSGSSLLFSNQKTKSKSLHSNTNFSNKSLLEKSLLYLDVFNCYGELK